MNNFIYYFYNIRDANIIYDNKYYSFLNNGYVYRLYIIDSDIDNDFLINLEKRLLTNTLINEIIFNKNGKIVSSYNNQKYVLMKLFVNPSKKITLEEINYLANVWAVRNLRINYATLWERKIDYLEKMINENGKKYPIITDSFNYFVGMVENAISYYNNTLIDNNYIYVISHKKIRFNDTIDVIYNPLNIIFDYRIRDIAEYIKNAFFNDNRNIFEELELYLKKNPFSTTDARLLVSRLMYPSFYFDMYEDILIDNVDEKIIINIVARLTNYERYLSDIISYLNKLYGVEEIKWLNYHK